MPPVDDWRQYPAFPSAYPPTPLVKQTQIAAAAVVSASNSVCPSISEESSQQDFRQSLLPQHNIPNPSYVGDKSDEIDTQGVQTHEEITISVMDVDGKGVPDESIDQLDEEDADEFESEDEFNITLRTPEAPLRILTSPVPLRPLSREISPLSLPSIGSGVLTTADGGSSLYTPSTESTDSSEPPVPPPKPAGDKPALRPTPPVANVRVRNSRAMAKVARSTRPPVNRAVVSQRRPPRPKQSAAGRTHEQLGFYEPENEPPRSTLDGGELTAKRRRVSLSPPVAATVSEPIRRRVARPTSTSAKFTRAVPVQKPASLRPSTRQLKTNVKLLTISSPESSVTPDDPSIA